ncbi:hypothetical protein K435DRAFT_879209 [Dendrothele bispora CBS 962.96]|uniref:Uncharacterized protein n=1 Tax=Dendrothele bispora (strain CBS 962.96) TaxID=1314807 RepID=A0A4V4HAQ2_DENBC|nr:hypothetical protein K435DRAFT_879209 [Dendrothele bispora CBS 962.96]
MERVLLEALGGQTHQNGKSVCPSPMDLSELDALVQRITSAFALLITFHLILLVLHYVAQHGGRFQG